jgi:hypothetical protein
MRLHSKKQRRRLLDMFIEVARGPAGHDELQDAVQYCRILDRNS